MEAFDKGLDKVVTARGAGGRPINPRIIKKMVLDFSKTTQGIKPPMFKY
jgi:hypothetical protein